MDSDGFMQLIYGNQELTYLRCLLSVDQMFRS